MRARRDSVRTPEATRDGHADAPVRHHFSYTWLDRGAAEGDLIELNGWSSPRMFRRYGASARSARARCTYDCIMEDRP